MFSLFMTNNSQLSLKQNLDLNNHSRVNPKSPLNMKNITLFL